MKTMVTTTARHPLELKELPVPEPAFVWARVQTCAVCRAGLHVVDGDLT